MNDTNHKIRAAVLLTASAVLAVFAVTRAHADTRQYTVVAAATLDQVIDNVTTWLVGLLAGLATMFLTVGGVKYLIASGDPGEVEKAKGALRSAAIGYAVAVLAPGLVSILQKIVGGK
ncbi:pilin [Catenulispora rubra]|uniref:pilin n=1 Tax=Catenulispora rubra TaxID=280293 RepID=UPI002B27A102|nr:pilin [Catenulispora rubra]